MPDSRTSESLLQNMQQSDTREKAWADFLDRYGEKILIWAKRFFKNIDDAKDVTQEVAVKLLQAFRNDWKYDPDGSFRGWLKTVTQNVALNVIRRRRDDPLTGGTANLRRIDEVAAADDLVKRIDSEYERKIFARAKSAIRNIVNPVHWQVFELHLEDHHSTEIAELLGLSYGNVTTVLQRVKQQVDDEARRLSGVLLLDDGGSHGNPVKVKR